MSTIRLETSDGDILKVDRKIANLSLTIREQLLEFEMDGVPEEERLVKISHVCSRVLRIVLRWFNYHKDDPIPNIIEDTPETRPKTFCEWDTNFVKVDNGLLFELILAANFLEIKPLLHLTCQTVANKIHGKSPEEIRKAFYPDEEKKEKSKNENRADDKETWEWLAN